MIFSSIRINLFFNILIPVLKYKTISKDISNHIFKFCLDKRKIPLLQFHP